MTIRHFSAVLLTVALLASIAGCSDNGTDPTTGGGIGTTVSFAADPPVIDRGDSPPAELIENDGKCVDERYEQTDLIRVRRLAIEVFKLDHSLPIEFQIVQLARRIHDLDNNWARSVSWSVAALDVVVGVRSPMLSR